MEKSRELYSYPFYDVLSYSMLDEIIYYNFINKFYEIFKEPVSINFVVYALGRNYIKRLREIAPYANLIYGEEYTDDIDNFIETLYKKNKVKVHKIKSYYCEKCDEYFKRHEIKIIERIVKRDIVKIRIGKKLYFVDEMSSGEEPLGVYLSKEDKFLIVDLSTEKWLTPVTLLDILVNGIEVPKNKIREISLNDLRNYEFEAYVLIGNGLSGLIKKGDKEVKFLGGRVSSYTVIYSVQRKMPIKICPRCDNVLVEEDIPILIAERNKKRAVLSSSDGSYKLPLLYCSNCGYMEYGKKIKDCPICGSIMERKFYLKPELMAIGAYLHNLKNSPNLIFLHQNRELIKRTLSEVFHIYHHDPFVHTIYLHHRISDEIGEEERCVLLAKRRGKITESDRKKIQKLKNVVENIVKYIEIYGANENYDDVDEWLLWKNEVLKKEMRDFVEHGKIAAAFEKLYEHILENISRFYIPLKRREPLNLKPIKESIMLLYPYLPEFSKSLLKRLGITDLSMTHQEPIEIESVEVAREFIEKLRKYREKSNIPLKEPLKKVVFVSEYADDINALYPYIQKVENILVFNAVIEWEEMEIEVEPNIKEISSTYRAWAPKIAFLLRRKNVREIIDAMEKGGYTLGVEGFIIKITPKMIKYIKKIPEGYDHIESKYGEIYIYTERDISTRRIRLVREIVRRINVMRKEIDMDYDDLIDVSISGDSEAIKMIRGYDDEIREKCLVRNIEFKYIEYGYIIEWPIMGYRITIGINPLFKRWVIKAFKSIPGIDDSRAELLFKMGYGSIYELMEADPEDLAEVTGMPLNLANGIIEYLYSTAFKSKKEKKKEFCPFCGAQLDPEDDYCPYCGAPIRVKMKEKKIKKGNLYMVIGDLERMINSIPEDLLKEKKLLITKDDPEEIKKKYRLKNTSTIWISYVPFGKSIKPKELEKLEAEINAFINSGKLIIVDCFDLLLAINGLDSLIELLGRVKQSLKEKDAYLFFNIEELESFEMGKIMKYVDGEIK